MSVSGRFYRVVVCIVLLSATFSFAFLGQSTYAHQIDARTLTLQSGGTGDAGSKAGGVTNHHFTFTLPAHAADSTVGSIRFLYCTTAGGTCDMPDGLVTTGATLAYEDGITGFAIDTDDVNGSPYLIRSAAAIGTSPVPVTITLNSITNPTPVGDNGTFYVRITTFSGTNGATGVEDTGVVAASTAKQIELTGTMPESLQFCTGGTISVTDTVPDCSTATSGAVSFNQLFSPTDTAWAISQMAASTNAGAGYAISVNGSTLMSGSNEITTMASATTSIHGISQFGMNLMANTTPSVTGSADVAPAAGALGGTYKGQPLTGYNTANTYRFVSGGTVADSAYGEANGTDAQIFTASYIVNVSGSQAAGTYTTTLTYICTATF